MTDVLRAGLSPCPNDTFMFHGLVHGRVAAGELRFEPGMEDVEALNLRLVEDRDAPAISKVSVAALGSLTKRYTVLAAGAALGRGVGPLVVARRPGDLAGLGASSRVGIPGQYTTAHLLLRVFAPEVRTDVLRFEKIMPAVAAGTYDAGLVIHESRFTFHEHGLHQLADLGDLWEADTGLPLPLGVIVARRDLGEDRIRAVEEGLRKSVEAAFADREAPAAWIREHAQEMDPEVCRKHVDLYVNDFSVDLGEEGRAAVEALLARGRDAGFLPDGPSPWR